VNLNDRGESKSIILFMRAFLVLAKQISFRKNRSHVQKKAI